MNSCQKEIIWADKPLAWIFIRPSTGTFRITRLLKAGHDRGARSPLSLWTGRLIIEREPSDHLVPLAVKSLPECKLQLASSGLRPVERPPLVRQRAGEIPDAPAHRP